MLTSTLGQVPRNVKESVDQLRDAIQAALSGRQSRMDIEAYLPIANSARALSPWHTLALILSLAAMSGLI